MDDIGCHEVIRETSAGIFPILERYRVSFSTAVVASSLTGWCPYGSWATCTHTCRRRYTSCFTATILQSSKHVRARMTSTRSTWPVLPCVSTNRTAAGAEGQGPVSMLAVGVFDDYSITTKHRCVLRVLRKPSNAAEMYYPI